MDQSLTLYSPTDLEKSENQGFSISSEQIASAIFDKLISLTLTEVSRREINRNIPKKCFFYMRNMIKNFLKLEFLPHDRDDLYINNQDLLSIRPDSKSTNEINKLKNIISQGSKNSIIAEIKENKSDTNSYSKQLNSSASPTDEEGSGSIIGKNCIQSDDLDKLDFLENEDRMLINKKQEEIYMDNYIYGFNDWTIMDEPVIFM